MFLRFNHTRMLEQTQLHILNVVDDHYRCVGMLTSVNADVDFTVFNAPLFSCSIQKRSSLLFSHTQVSERHWNANARARLYLRFAHAACYFVTLVFNFCLLFDWRGNQNVSFKGVRSINVIAHSMAYSSEVHSMTFHSQNSLSQSLALCALHT